MKFTIHSYTTVSSTNKVACELARKGAGHAEIVVSENQTEGRGRLGKSWQSPPGKGLYFSIILRPAKLLLEDYSKITMTSGLAVANVLQRLTGIASFLKWPNDVYLAGRKCCGILAESSAMNGGDSTFVILGVGVNVLTEPHEFEPELADKATSLYIETGRLFVLNNVLQDLAEEILVQFARLENNGFAEILDEWKNKDFLLGKWLEWVTNSGSVVYGRSEGPGADGELRVRDREGILHQVISGDVNLALKK